MRFPPPPQHESTRNTIITSTATGNRTQYTCYDRLRCDNSTKRVGRVEISRERIHRPAIHQRNHGNTVMEGMNGIQILWGYGFNVLYIMCEARRLIRPSRGLSACHSGSQRAVRLLEVAVGATVYLLIVCFFSSSSAIAGSIIFGALTSMATRAERHTARQMFAQ